MAQEGDPALLLGAKMESKTEDEGEKKNMDEDKLKKIFRQFDSDGSGSIDVGELKDAMRMLGVKVSANSAQRILNKIDKDGNGTVEWEEFHEFFCKVRDPEEIKSLLSEANQQYLDYKAQVEGDPNFSKKFIMPPMVVSKQKYVGHNDNVEAVCWLQKGLSGQFLSCGVDGELCVWDSADDAKKPKAKQTIDCACGIYSMCASSDGLKAIIGTSQKADNVGLVDLFSGADDKSAIVKKFSGQTTPVYSVAMSENMENIASGSKNGHVVVHDISRDTPLGTVHGHETTCYSCDFNKEGSHVVSASSDGTVKIWDIKTMGKGKADVVIEDAAAMGTVFQALWNGDKHILSCGDDYCIKRWDIRNLSEGPVANYFGHTSPVKCIAVSADGYFLVSACDDGSIRIWLADEKSMLDDVKGAAQRKLASKEKEIEKLRSQLQEGEVDKNTVQQAIAAKDELQASADHYEKVYSDRCALGCIQARIGLEGHTLGIASVAWNDAENAEGNGIGQILSGAQDQSIRLFEVEKTTLTSF